MTAQFLVLAVVAHRLRSVEKPRNRHRETAEGGRGDLSSPMKSQIVTLRFVLPAMTKGTLSTGPKG